MTDEYQHLMALLKKSDKSNQASISDTTSEGRRRTIPKPNGECGRDPNGSRAGYNLAEESLLDEEQLRRLRVSEHHLVSLRISLNPLELTVKRFVYRFMDVTMPFSKHKDSTSTWRAAFKKVCHHPYLIDIISLIYSAIASIPGSHIMRTTGC